MLIDSADAFATEAALFERWARHGADTGHASAREALVRITKLYACALALPPAWSDELADQPDAEGIAADELAAVFAACARLPIDWYGEVYDPLPVPPDEPGVGSLADDIADIYGDVVSGLREYEAGRRARAIWEWGFGLQHHWGEHATSAIRALHCWLAANGWDGAPSWGPAAAVRRTAKGEAPDDLTTSDAVAIAGTIFCCSSMEILVVCAQDPTDWLGARCRMTRFWVSMAGQPDRLSCFWVARTQAGRHRRRGLGALLQPPGRFSSRHKGPSHKGFFARPCKQGAGLKSGVFTTVMIHDPKTEQRFRAFTAIYGHQLGNAIGCVAVKLGLT